MAGAGMKSLTHRPIEFRDAAAFVLAHHRHRTPPQGHRFSIAAWLDGQLVGVVIVGRPVARARQDGHTVEITRLCTDGTKNACSFLYGRATKAALALGWRRIGTYTLKREPGASLVAAGWVAIAEVKGRSWDTPSRRRDDQAIEDKLFWEPARLQA